MDKDGAVIWLTEPKLIEDEYEGCSHSYFNIPTTVAVQLVGCRKEPFITQIEINEVTK